MLTKYCVAKNHPPKQMKEQNKNFIFHLPKVSILLP